MADNCKLCRIALENVSVVRGGQTLLQDVSMHIHCGQLTVLIGQNGAGKTTLIKKLLTGSVAKEKIILLENEYGEVGVDGSFMKDSGIIVDELNSGCICCTLVGDFQKAVDDLIAKYHPDRLLIEPSGVGKLSEILAAVERAKERHSDLVVTGCATVVDAGKCRMYMKNFGEFFLDQIKTSATVIFSRTQLLSAERIEKSRALVEEQHPGVRIVTTPWDDLSADTLLEVIESGKPMEIHLDDDDDDDEDEHEHHHHHDQDEDDHDHECCCGHHHDDDDDEDEHEHHHHHDHDEDHDHEHHHEHDENCTCGCHDHDHDHHHHHHHADEVFTSWGIETPNTYSAEDIEKILTALDSGEYGAILRAKGMVPAPDGTWVYYDYVPEEHDIRSGKPEVTGKICVIGSKLDEDKLAELFRK